jgi:hypothetical protein
LTRKGRLLVVEHQRPDGEGDSCGANGSLAGEYFPVQDEASDARPAPAKDKEAAGPSFDCTKAATDVEKAICARPELAELDRAIAQALASVRAAFAEDGEALAELDAEKRRFSTERDELLVDSRGKDFLSNAMEERLDWLRSVDLERRAGFEGSWIAASGASLMTHQAGGAVIVMTENVELGWECRFNGRGSIVGDTLTAAAEAKELGEWKLKSTRKGRTLEVDFVAPPGGSEPKRAEGPFRDRRCSLRGRYFPKKASG